MKSENEAASHIKWLKAEVQEVIDNNCPSFPHAEVMQEVRVIIAKAQAAKHVWFGIEEIGSQTSPMVPPVQTKGVNLCETKWGIR